MILEHYSDAADPLDLDTLKRHRRHQSDKPTGLWVSVPGPADWPAYCKGENLQCLGEHRHVVTLADDASLLRLATLDAVLDLHRDFPGPDVFGDGFAFSIDWTRIVERWDGILITPYQRGARLDPRSAWYYSWDCASGCIWNRRAIASATLSTS
jgi:hypothetical protein